MMHHFFAQHVHASPPLIKRRDQTIALDILSERMTEECGKLMSSKKAFVSVLAQAQKEVSFWPLVSRKGLLDNTVLRICNICCVKK